MLFPMNQQAEDLLMGAPSEVGAQAAARTAHPAEPAGGVRLFPIATEKSPGMTRAF